MGIDTITIKYLGEKKDISVSDIMFFKSDQKYVDIHTNDGRVYISGRSLTKFSEMLEGTFLRVHRSYLVSLDEIKELVPISGTRNHHILLKSTDFKPLVSRRNTAFIRRLLKNRNKVT